MIPRPRITIQVEGQVSELRPEGLSIRVGLHHWPVVYHDPDRDPRPVLGQWIAALIVPRDTAPAYSVENPPPLLAWGRARTPASATERGNPVDPKGQPVKNGQEESRA